MTRFQFRPLRSRLLFGALLLPIALAACGGTPPPVDSSTYPMDRREKEKLDAEKRGESGSIFGKDGLILFGKKKQEAAPNGVAVNSFLWRASLDTLHELNAHALAGTGDPEIAARIQSYELAYRLQTSAPELMDLSSEPPHILELYGIKDVKETSYARNCLLARRLIERGVRFVQLFHEAWDQHGDLTKALKKNCLDTDRASAALVTDLRQRGLLDDTLVVWGGEFGRTPMVQGSNDGRDHHNRCFTLWLAGAGLKRGHVHGSTDELGFNVVRDPVHVHDLNATLLHLLGLDHTRLTHRFQGRDYRLTDVHGNVVSDLIA